MEISFDKFTNFVDGDENLTYLAFLYQITEKDIRASQSSGQWNSLNLQQKIELVADIVGGRTIGYNPFPSIAQYPATFNLSNAVNRTSIFGGALWLLHEVGLVDAKWGKRGEKIAVGGIFAGVFDAPVSSSTYSTQSGSSADQSNRARALNAQLEAMR